MNPAQKIATFVLGLAVVFGVAYWAGEALRPTADTAAYAGAPAKLPSGLAATQQGYTLTLADPVVEAAKSVSVAFRILDPGGAPVTRYTENHEKLLHFIVVRNDLVGFQHVHPALDDTGTWRVPVDLSRGGDYRVFADFTPAGSPVRSMRGGTISSNGASDQWAGCVAESRYAMSQLDRTTDTYSRKR